MSRRLARAAFVLCALPSSALANPSISTEVGIAEVPNSLATRVTHQLMLTAGAAVLVFRRHRRYRVDRLLRCKEEG